MRRALVLSAAVAALACAVPARAPAHTYGGETTKGGGITFRVAADSATVSRLRAVRELRCRRGRIRSVRRGSFRQTRPFVRRSGRVFRGSIRTRGPRGSLVRRGRFSVRIVLRGELLAVGVFRERLRLRDGTRCTSGRVRFAIPLTDTND